MIIYLEDEKPIDQSYKDGLELINVSADKICNRFDQVDSLKNNNSTNGMFFFPIENKKDTSVHFLSIIFIGNEHPFDDSLEDICMFNIFE